MFVSVKNIYDRPKKRPRAIIPLTMYHTYVYITIAGVKGAASPLPKAPTRRCSADNISAFLTTIQLLPHPKRRLGQTTGRWRHGGLVLMMGKPSLPAVWLFSSTCGC